MIRAMSRTARYAALYLGWIAFCVALWEGLFSARPFDDETGPP